MRRLFENDRRKKVSIAELNSTAILAAAIREIASDPTLLSDVRRGLLTFAEDDSPDAIRRGLMRIANALERSRKIGVTDSTHYSR